MPSGDLLHTLMARAATPTDSSPAAAGRRNGIDCIQFALTEETQFVFVLPAHYEDGGITLTVHMMMASATTGNVELSFEWCDLTGEDADSYTLTSPAATADIAVPATNGEIFTTSKAFTDGANIDNLSASALGILRVSRTAASASEASGDLQLIAIEVRET